MLRPWSVVVVAAWCLAACASAPPPPAPPPKPVGAAPAPRPDPGEPMQVQLAAKRTGNAVYLDVVGSAQRHPEGRPFEDPASWKITARSGGRVLDRVVNGPVEIERQPLDRESTRFDVVVRFSVAFAMPEDASSVDVQVTAPFAAPYGRTFDDLVPPKPTNEGARRSKRKPVRQGRRAPR